MTDPTPYEFVNIKGIPPVGGKPGIRQEFTAFATDKPTESIQVSLFIRALNRWYTKPYADRLSYFSVASIHGYPGNLKWDKSEAPPYNRNDLGHYIYCTHNMLTFPTWHRPYMALFEQTLWQIMDEVINDPNELVFTTETEKQAWTAVKDSWRLPYWDWALTSYKGEVPDLFKPQTVQVRKPANADGTIPAPEAVTNPLFRYQLVVDGKLTRMGDLPSPYNVADVNDDNDGEQDHTWPWSKCSGTSRYGITSYNLSDDEAAGKNNTAGIASAINSHQYYGKGDPSDPTSPVGQISKLAVSDLVYRMFLGDSNPTWASFSSTITGKPTDNDNWKEWISLEYIHNNLHVFIGGGDGWATGIGHMMNVPVAAFDPIFYMHHCNIDHYLAVWQTLYPNTWFTDTDSPSPRDNLIPFHHDFGGNRGVDYFNSNDVQDWQSLGYQYDVLERRPNETDDAYVQRIKDYITQSYPHTGDVILRDHHKLFSSHGSDERVGGSSFFANKDVDDYLINVIYDRYGHNGGSPYTIHFFLGAAPLQAEIHALAEVTVEGGRRAPKAIAELPRHVGSVFTFSSPMPASLPDDGSGGEGHGGSKSMCGNCAKQHDDGVLSRATVPLTISLYHDAANRNIDAISSPFDGNAVKSYLANNLSWIAVNTRGIIIPWSELGQTRVYVLKGKGKHNYSATDGSDGIFSKYSHYEPLPEATHGKAAGASHDEYGQMVTGSV